MDASIYISDKYKHRAKLAKFMQFMANRIMFGMYRYAGAEFNASQDYRDRIDRSLARYDETGNTEFLVDAANYCWLELENPLHPNTHFKATDAHGRGRHGR